MRNAETFQFTNKIANSSIQKSCKLYIFDGIASLQRFAQVCLFFNQMICQFRGSDMTLRLWTISGKLGSSSGCQLERASPFQSPRDPEVAFMRHPCWNASGKLLAASVNHVINIWPTSGERLRIAVNLAIYYKLFLLN